MEFRFSHIIRTHMPAVAQSLIDICIAGDVFVLVGDIGAGKTTLVSECVKKIGSHHEASSPTFAIIAQYPLDEPYNDIHNVIHVDTYRLTHVNELYELGLENISDSHAITFVEWGERIEDFLDANHFRILIVEEDENMREMTIDCVGDFSEERVRAVSNVLVNSGWKIQ